MKKSIHENPTCQICHKEFDPKLLFPVELIRPHLIRFIKQKMPDWRENGYICAEDLQNLRSEYIESIINKEKGEAKGITKDFIKSIRKHELIAENIDTKYESTVRFGERLADRIASFGGSWKFIIFFGIILLIWIGINTVALLNKPFDPYPYILLNLILSCLAAIQAPVIMMSQNRQEAKDRMRSEHDYKVNLKSELEVRLLNEKLDFLLIKQWQRLMEIQSLQTEIMEEILKREIK